MASAAGFRCYKVLAVVFTKHINSIFGALQCLYRAILFLKCDLRVQIGKFTKMRGGDHYIFRHFCIFLQLYLSRSHTKYVKQQVISCSTTLVYHSHIEKCDLGVEKLNKLNSWRPFWKISCNLFSSPN